MQIAVATAGTGAACIGTYMLIGAAKGAAIGAIQGAISGAVIGAITEGIKTGSWEGALKGAITGAVNGAADGFMFGAIGGAVSGALNSKFCFVAGTLVMTKQGLKAIEDIRKGDLVLSYNDNLGIYDYKDVVDVYINETTELCHIKTPNDAIVCTPNHSILTENGWILASEIKPEDTIITTEGTVEVLSVEKEALKDKIRVYNFNVLGYHTYVVGSDLLVVHNSCTGDLKKGATHEVKYKYNGKVQKAYNTGGGKTFYSIDRSGHGGSVYKGFELIKNKKIMKWVGDFDEMLNAIPNKHKSPLTIFFDIIKITPIM